MGANKISQLPELNTPTLSGVTAIVDSNVTYKTSLESIKSVLHSNIEVTYSELVNLIQTSGLTPMYDYVITDFQTAYWMLDGEGEECNNGIPMVGNIEPLIVRATTKGSIDNVVISTVYHNDYIEYNWDPSDFIYDDAFTNLPDDLFKGVITFRREVNYNNSAGWDIRTVKFRRWESIAPEWNSGTTYNISDIVVKNNIMYFSLSNNINQDPSISNTNDWSQLLNLTNNKFWNSNSTGIIFSDVFIPSGSEYFDFPTVLLDEPGSFNNNIITTSTSTFINSQTRLLNIIFLGASSNINIKEDCKIITIGNGSRRVDIRSGVSRVIIGLTAKNIVVRSSSERLIFSDSVNNIDINSSCNNILMGKSVDDITLKIKCSYISLGFGCKSIVIGPSSYNIVIGTNSSKINIAADSYRIILVNNCTSIDIGNSCHDIYINPSNNIIVNNDVTFIIVPIDSNNNIFESNTSGDFSLSSHIIQPYTCVIYRNAGGTVKLRYFDANDNIEVVAINE